MLRPKSNVVLLYLLLMFINNNFTYPRAGRENYGDDAVVSGFGTGINIFFGLLSVLFLQIGTKQYRTTIVFYKFIKIY